MGLERKLSVFTLGETFDMVSKKTTRPDYMVTSSDGAHSKYISHNDYRQIQYESGSGTTVDINVNGIWYSQARSIKYYEPAQFTPFVQTADLNNRFDGCKMKSTGKDGKSLYQK